MHTISASAPPASTPFENETPAQRVDHREIAWRDRQRKQRQPSPLMVNLRKAEMQRIFRDRWGRTLPDDDAGRSDLRLMADHLAQLGTHYITGWARVWAPWLTEDELDALIRDVGQGRYWKPDDLGRELNLKYRTRKRLRIKTIREVDRTTAQRRKARKKQKAAAEAARRAKAGAKPHALSEAQLKPWLALGTSRPTYFRHKKAARNETGETDSCPILLESQWDTNQSQSAPPPPRAALTARAAGSYR
jgi:hypothetical protein